MPATTHAASTSMGVPTACAITADFRKMPVPIVIPTTNEVACSSVRSRRGWVWNGFIRSERTITTSAVGVSEWRPCRTRSDTISGPEQGRGKTHVRHIRSAPSSSASSRDISRRSELPARQPGPLGLTLIGWTSDHPDERVSLAFSGRAPGNAARGAGRSDRGSYSMGGRYRIASAPREWIVEATAIHLHREIATAFYRAIPPRPAPWSRRLFLRVLLAWWRTRWGKRSVGCAVSSAVQNDARRRRVAAALLLGHGSLRMPTSEA